MYGTTNVNKIIRTEFVVRSIEIYLASNNEIRVFTFTLKTIVQIIWGTMNILLILYQNSKYVVCIDKHMTSSITHNINIARNNYYSWHFKRRMLL